MSPTAQSTECYPALVVSPSCNDDVTVKKDQCLVRSFIDSKFYSVARKDIKELDLLSLPESELCTKPGLRRASVFLKARIVPDNWKMDISEILESSSSDDEECPAEEHEEEKEKEAKRRKKSCLRKNLILKRGTTSSNSFISLWKTEVLQSTKHLCWAIKISISSNSSDWSIIRGDVTVLTAVLYGSKFIWTLAFQF